MRYVWEDSDVHSGMVVVGICSQRATIGYFDRAFHGKDNGWYVTRHDGEMVFLPDVPSMVTWLNGFGAQPEAER